MMNIVQKVKSLDLPTRKYVVIGGASLAARGIREANDIDILVLPEVFDDLKNKGFEEKFFENGSSVLKKDVFEIGKKFTVTSYNPPAEVMIKNAEIIDGVAFSDLKQEIEFKKAMGRDKDLRDIELIEEFLEKNVQ